VGASRRQSAPSGSTQDPRSGCVDVASAARGGRPGVGTPRVRTQGCGAIDSRPQAGSPLIVIPIAASVPSCSKPSRCGLARAEHAARLTRRPTLTAPARADVSEARVGTKKRAFRSNKETDEGKKMRPPCRNSLIKKPHTRKPRPGKGTAVPRAGLWGFESRGSWVVVWAARRSDNAGGARLR
jgi:hypothetical protein